MRLRSGRNTESTSSNRPIPTVYLKSLGFFPRVLNKSQKGWKRQTLRRWKLLHKLWFSQQHDLNLKRQAGPRYDATSFPPPSSIPEHIRTVLSDLHLPFYEPTSNDNDVDPDVELTTSLLSTRLGWSISSTDLIPVPSVLRRRSSSPALSAPVLAPLDAYARDTGPAMNIPPNGYPEIRLDSKIEHETQRFEFAGLVLPTDWEPLQQKHYLNIRGGTSDSNKVSDMASIKKRLGISSEQTPDLRRSISPSVDPCAESQHVVVMNNTLLHPRTRSQWEIIGRLQFGEEEWRLDASSHIAERDDKRHVGNIDRNQFSKNRDSWPQCSILKLIHYEPPVCSGPEIFYPPSGRSESSDVFIEFLDSDSSDGQVPDAQETCSIPMEIAPGHHLGDAIADIMTCDQLPISHNLVVKPSRAMRCSNQTMVVLSAASRVPSETLHWKAMHLPILFAAQHCIKGEQPRASAEMAYALHQTLLTLVLYYLDTRCSPHEQLPTWMIVYGIIYHDEGFAVHAHFPVFHFSDADTGGWTPRTFGWAFYSVPIMTFGGISSGWRRREVVTLLRLQSHARHMLHRLQEWTGYERALRLIS